MQRTRPSGAQTHLKPTVHIDSLPELASVRQRALSRAGSDDNGIMESFTTTDDAVTGPE